MPQTAENKQKQTLFLRKVMKQSALTYAESLKSANVRCRLGQHDEGHRKTADQAEKQDERQFTTCFDFVEQNE